MNTSTLQPGDRIEANVRGVHFEARIVGKPQGLLAILPKEPQRISYRHLKATQICRKLGSERGQSQ